ncbi:hypothetical protein, variant [Capsaspora owczarzaki ATCC 30864]|nr:hypothetical protein, variant [Capsaspora owczarzaki ATCC 30864]KJE94992.1 hypothetical protein, variant [Capsaspora owczarzaki ATCC 30864]|eukprot:XP_011270536.1 hypothetical protein, variant [Capsaspora owczarzaki ATCC 30864]
MPPALPGFYYDPVKQRYFVLPPGGAPPTLPVQEAQHLQRQRDADHDKHREANLLSNQPDCMTSLGSLHRPLISNRTKKCNMATRTALREVLDPSGMRSRALNVVPERSQPASLLKSVACRRRSATCSENSNNRYHAVQFAPSCEGDAGDTLLAVGVGNRLALWMLNWRGQTAGIPDTQDNHFEDIRQAEWLIPGKHAGSHEHHTTEPSDYFLPFTTELYNANSSFSPVSCIRWSPAALGLRQSTSMDETCDYNASHTSRTAATHVNRQTNNEAVHEALARSQLSHGMDLFAWCCPGIDVEIAMCNRSRVSISTQMSGAVQLSRPLMSIARLIFFDEQSDWPTVSMSKQLHAGAALSLDYDRHFVPRMLVGGGQGIYVVDLTRNSVWTKMNDTDGVDVAILQSEPQMPSSLYAGLTTEGVVRLYDMRSGKFQRICAIGGRICGLKALDRGQNQLLVASNNGTFGLWDARMPRHSICEYQEHVNTHLPLEIATDPCEAIVASGGEDGRVRIWDIDSGRLVKTLERSDTGIVDRISIGSTSFGEPLLVTASSSGLELFAC